MILSFTIPDEKVNELKNALLRQRPVPLDEEGNPTMSDLLWIKQCVKDRILQDYRIGKQLLAQDGVVCENDLIS